MLKTYQSIYDLLSPVERRRAILLLCMILIMALLDMVGIAAIMPFLGVLTDPSIIVSSPYLSWIYQQLGFTSDKIFIISLGLIFLGLLVGSLAFKTLTMYALLNFTNMRSYSIACKLVQGYLHQPYEWFLNRHSGDLSKNVLSEVDQAVRGTIVPSLQIIANGTLALAIVLLLLATDPLLALIVSFSLGTAYGLFYLTLHAHLKRIGERRVRANNLRFKLIQETFGSIKHVKIRGLEANMMARFVKPAHHFARNMAMAQVIGQIPRYFFEAVAFGGILTIAMYFFAVEKSLLEHLPTLGLFAFAGYRLMPVLQTIFKNLTQIRFTQAAMDNLCKDIRLLPENPTRSQKTSLTFQKEITFDSVTYSYPKANSTIIKDLSLSIPANTTTGIKGKTGSGKTTLVDILLGLLHPLTSGTVKVDGVPLQPANLRAWQQKIGYVPQGVILVDDTIRANIAFGVKPEDIDDSLVCDAARMAQIHDFILEELQEAYETMVGERGIRLSGGQVQRIGIARALYHQPEVLVFDEATSALDNQTEAEIMKTITKMSGSRTIILIAHKLDTLKHCDQIIDLDELQTAI